MASAVDRPRRVPAVGGHSSAVPRLLAVVSLLILGAGRGIAHTDSPGSPPLVPEVLHLSYRKSADIVALFARERLPNSPSGHVPRAARSDEAESLVPPGVDAVL